MHWLWKHSLMIIDEVSSRFVRNWLALFMDSHIVTVAQ